MEGSCTKKIQNVESISSLTTKKVNLQMADKY